MADDSTARRGPLRAFRDWRRSRPFWGGLLLIIAAVEMLVAPSAQSLILPLNLVIYAGIAGISVYLVSLLLIALGLLVWVQPQQRMFYGVVGTLLSIASFVTANFGGFVIGMLLGIVGGALVFSWEPARPRGGRRRARRPRGTGAEGAGADGEGGRPRALAAAPIALLLVLPAAAPADFRWPWDDWFGGGGDGEESAPADPGASPSPSPSPSPSASERPGGPGEEPGGGDPEEGGGEEPGEEREESEEPGDVPADGADPAECELRTGEESVAAGEEELLDAVRACQAAREAGESPEVPVVQGEDGPFTASDAESGLTAEWLTMRGARFGGVVEYPASSGPERYLRIVMTEGDVTDGELWWRHGESRASLALPSMNLSGTDGGDIVMHVRSLTITILGIPITFTPDFPPPLLPSHIPVPNVDVSRPVAEADHLAVEGLDLRADSEG
ncbi:DUF6114 domain-containing protein [Nocardiopsis potens]|uniref:DUF6114 domain-containing protein n=1 Tax=Nocardiopsis potens TaxID=1246458 RepID=UPI00034C49DD|nr:DUF6114 domain-containing protein [Nocardiopsis potens]